MTFCLTTETRKMAASIKKSSIEEQIIRDISTQFFEMVPIRRIRWRTSQTIEDTDIGPDTQRALLQSTVLHSLCKRFPPSLSYQRAFMKQLLHKLEDSEADICDDIYETYTDLLQQKEEEDDTLCYKTYTLPCGQTINLQESVHLISQGTTGLSTWQAALHLGEWTLENSKYLEDKNILELGSGLGLTGIVVCKKCQVKSFVFSDFHHQVLYLLMRNIETNFAKQTCLSQPCYPDLSPTASSRDITERKDGKMMKTIRRQLSINAEPSSACTVSMCSDIMEISYTSTASSTYEEENCEDLLQEQDFHVESQNWMINDISPVHYLTHDERIRLLKFDWEGTEDSVVKGLCPDIILAADVVYDKSIIPALVKVMKKILSRELDNGQRPLAFVASTIRNEDTRDHFLIVLANEGLVYEIVDPPRRKIFHYEDTIPIEILKIQYLGS